MSIQIIRQKAKVKTFKQNHLPLPYKPKSIIEFIHIIQK